MTADVPEFALVDDCLRMLLQRLAVLYCTFQIANFHYRSTNSELGTRYRWQMWQEQ